LTMKTLADIMLFCMIFFPLLKLVLLLLASFNVIEAIKNLAERK